MGRAKAQRHQAKAVERLQTKRRSTRAAKKAVDAAETAVATGGVVVKRTPVGGKKKQRNGGGGGSGSGGGGSDRRTQRKAAARVIAELANEVELSGDSGDGASDEIEYKPPSGSESEDGGGGNDSGDDSGSGSGDSSDDGDEAGWDEFTADQETIRLASNVASTKGKKSVSATAAAAVGDDGVAAGKQRRASRREVARAKADITEYISKQKKAARRAAVSGGTAATDALSSVLYVGHVPHGFYEPQMRSYFSQFGTVEKLRLSRNRKTGRSKHYAFVQFDDAETASIVAATMDKYILSNRRLSCRVVPVDKLHKSMFKGHATLFRKQSNRKRYKAHINRDRTAEDTRKTHANLLASEQRLRKKLAAKGIDYDFPGYAATAAGGGDGKAGKVAGGGGKKKSATKKRKR